MIRILLIEDNPDDVDLVLRALKSRQIHAEIDVARDGQKALEMLGIDDQPSDVALPNAIVVDLKLPKVSGHDVLARLKEHERTQHIPVLAFSSSAELVDVQVAEQYGVQFLRKPTEYRDFLLQVGQALDRLIAG